MKYGTTKETTTIDTIGSTKTVIKKVRDYATVKVQKQYKIRTKVKNSKEEAVEYLKHSEKLREKKEAGILVLKDEDTALLPAFTTEYPKYDVDGSYFVVSCWTESVDLSDLDITE